jgi:hypothetical protein
MKTPDLRACPKKAGFLRFRAKVKENHYYFVYQLGYKL